MSTFNKIKISLFVLLISCLIIWGIVADIDVKSWLNDIRALSQAHPLQAAVWFILIFVGIKFTFLPMTSITIFAGYMFGPWSGSLVSIVAMTLSSVLMFLLSRFFGKSFVKDFLEVRFDLIKKYNKKLERHGFLTVLFFRIVPILPLGVINFGLGASRVSFWNYTFATIVGVAPGVILLSLTGQHLLDWDNPWFYIYGGLYVLMLLVVFLIAYFLRKKL